MKNVIVMPSRGERGVRVLRVIAEPTSIPVQRALGEVFREMGWRVRFVAEGSRDADLVVAVVAPGTHKALERVRAAQHAQAPVFVFAPGASASDIEHLLETGADTVFTGSLSAALLKQTA